jgi:YHS domain-containing protein
MVRGMMSVAALALALNLAGPALAKKAAAKAPTCPVCHMTLSTTKTKTNPKMVKIGGKTYYCCAQCPMDKAKGGAAKGGAARGGAKVGGAK